MQSQSETILRYLIAKGNPQLASDIARAVGQPYEQVLGFLGEMSGGGLVKVGNCSLSKAKTYRSAVRSLAVISREIRLDWRPSIKAEPWLNEMATLELVTDHYAFDAGDVIVKSFLNHARGWRGDTAMKIKKELREILKLYEAFDKVTV